MEDPAGPGRRDRTQLPTKIEFSARTEFGGPSVLEQVPDTIVRPYGQRAPLVQHYGEAVAIQQKIAALALRSETKARDVFDLELLFRLHNAESSSEPISPSMPGKQRRRRARSPTRATGPRSSFIDSDVLELYKIPKKRGSPVHETVALRLDRISRRDEAGR